MSGLNDFFVMLAEALHELVGLDASPELLRGIFLIALAGLAVAILIRAGQAAVQVGKAATGFVRKQVGNRFWRDAGKLASVISFVLLVLAYGLFWQKQTRTLDEALLDMGREHLAEIVPTAILTQVVLLSAYWFIFGRLTAVPTRTLLEPYRLVVGLAIAFAWLLLASVLPFVLAGGDSGTLGMAVLGLITVLGLCVPLLAKSVTAASKRAQQGKARASIAVALVALLMLTSLVATTVAAVYAAVSSDPSVAGLVATDFAILTVLLLFTGYRFRAYIGQAEVPAAVPHLIDFSLAISACAIALISLPGSEVTLGGVPPVVIAAGPALAVAAMIYIVHLRRSPQHTPRWRVCLAVAIVAGLLVGPVKALLSAPIAAFASILPVNWS
ncbi:hypothetical protein Rhe02_96670 [Rhizocola hellebori]|uniref:Uncharacterized protein n=1 Tax=Rhizocola hellebori TaxID=1392758 RepID=A0A8J3QKX0_9ACTN|nr:hypothetical protein [Rhizocola hellebori]GIH11600.1 hypothetical protein Rhe02_96670 [Rhizocola hellebori]